MSTSVLALWTSGAALAATAGARDEAANEQASEHEFLRLAVAALAAGATVRLLDLRPAAARGSNLGTEAQRNLAALAASGAVVETTGDIRGALQSADSVLRLAAPGRSGTPALLRISASWLRTVTERDLVSALSDAGQVARV